MLFHAGGDVNAVDNEQATPLHLAVRPNNPIEMDLVTLLIKAGANLDVQDSSGRRPIDALPQPQVRGEATGYSCHVAAPGPRERVLTLPRLLHSSSCTLRRPRASWAS